MKRSRRIERQIDSMKGLLKKRQQERKEWIERGESEMVISAHFDPKIEALEEEIRRLRDIDVFEEEEEVRYVKPNKHNRQNRRGR